MYSHKNKSQFVIRVNSVYSSDPMYLYEYVRQCLFTEMKLIKEAGGDFSLFPTDFEQPNITTEVIRNIDILRTRTQETSEDLSKLKQEHEAFALQYHEMTKLNAAFHQIPPQSNNTQLTNALREKEHFERLLTQRVARLVSLRLQLVEKLARSCELLNALQAQVLDEELIR